MGHSAARDVGPPESSEELLALLRHASAGLCFVDVEGRLLWANDAELALLGCSAKECIGHPIATFLLNPQAASEILDRLQRGETVEGYETSLRTVNGSVRRVILSATNLLRDGQIVHSRWITHDVTGLLEREQAARHRALDASRLKDEFLALLSHELRTPLGAILVWLGLLRQDGSDPAETTRALEIIERSARTLERIIEDLLHASRIAAGGLMLTPQLVDLRSVVHVVGDAGSADATLKGLALHLLVGEDPVWVMGDPGRLQQALSNLLSNAIRFTPAGGRVEVSLQVLDREAELRVVDTGEGMSPAFLPLAFERFRQQDATSTRVHHGLGLGLYVVRHVVSHHGGWVRAESPGGVAVRRSSSTSPSPRRRTTSRGFPVSPPRPRNERRRDSASFSSKTRKTRVRH